MPMKKQNIYKLLSLSVLFTSVFFLTGCTIPFLNQSSADVSLKYESVWEPRGTYADIISKYEETKPNVKIDFTDSSVASIDNYKSDLLNKLRSGEGAPDIMRIHISWIPEFKDFIEPAVYSSEEFEANYYPGVSAAVAEKIVGEDKYLVYGVPLYYDSLVLVYNKAHFAEAGINNPPANWEQFFRAAFFLTKKDATGQIVRSGAAFGSADIEFYTDIFGVLLSNSNIRFPNDLKENDTNLESVLRVLNRSTDWNPDFGNAGNAFVARKASMIIVPSWRVNDILAANKDIDLAVAPLPSASVDNSKIWPTYFIEVVNKKSSSTVEAWNFLRYLSSEESAKDIYSKQSSVRPLPSLPALKGLAGNIDNPILRSLGNYANTANATHLNGQSILFSDRAGNTKCVETVKSYIKSPDANALFKGLDVIKTDCNVK